MSKVVITENERVIGAHMRRIRNDAGLTAGELAEKIGDNKHGNPIQDDLIYLVETGKRRLELELFIKWCAACGLHFLDTPIAFKKIQNEINLN